MKVCPYVHTELMEHLLSKAVRCIINASACNLKVAIHVRGNWKDYVLEIRPSGKL
jgi:hypothetical protein